MRGFTLIETIIYIALLSIIMTGVLVSTYEIVASGSFVAGKTATQDEGNFVLGKFAWAFGDVRSAIPSGYTHSSPFVIVSSGEQIFIKKSGSEIELCRNTGAGSCSPYIPITTENVDVSVLAFYYGQGYIEASTTIDGKVFTLRRSLP